MTRTTRSKIGLSMALAACWGCGGSSAPSVSSSREEAVVRGTVTVHGAAPTKGEITFDPVNINRKDAAARTVEISKNGTYEVKTLIGENSVTVRSPETQKDQVLSANQRTIDVQPGEQNVAIELK